MFSKEINLKFEIDWKSIHLADIEWDVFLNKDDYSIDFVIQSYGMTDKIFKYKSVKIRSFKDIYGSKTYVI